MLHTCVFISHPCMWGYVGVCVYPQTMYSKKNKDWGELKLKQRQEGAAAPSFPGPGCTPNVSAVGEGKRGTHCRPRDSWLKESRGQGQVQLLPDGLLTARAASKTKPFCSRCGAFRNVSARSCVRPSISAYERNTPQLWDKDSFQMSNCPMRMRTRYLSFEKHREPYQETLPIKITQSDKISFYF